MGASSLLKAVELNKRALPFLFEAGLGSFSPEKKFIYAYFRKCGMSIQHDHGASLAGILNFNVFYGG